VGYVPVEDWDGHSGESTEEESPEMEDGRDATEEVAAPAAELQAEIRA